MSSKPLIAICIGHSRLVDGQTEGGAVSVGNVSEHTFNSNVAKGLRDALNESGIMCEIIPHYEGNGYTAAMHWLAGKLRDMGATLAVELHFNSADSPAARGHEFLHWNTSEKSKRLATSLSDAMRNVFPRAANRGLLPISKGERGWQFLNYTRCPAVICEPFFGSNAEEWRTYEGIPDTLAEVYAKGIKNYLRAEAKAA